MSINIASRISGGFNIQGIEVISPEYIKKVLRSLNSQQTPIRGEDIYKPISNTMLNRGVQRKFEIDTWKMDSTIGIAHIVVGLGRI